MRSPRPDPRWLVTVVLVASGCAATARSAPAAIAVPDTAPTSAISVSTTSTPPTTAPPATAPLTTATIITTTTVPTTSVPATAPTMPVERTITMAFSGDTLPHSPLWRRAARTAEEAGRTGHDFGPMLAGLAPLLESVDLAVCHLETPIAPEGEEYTTMPLYGVPAGIADAIADAGYDRCSTASNHTADRGVEGIERTVDVLEAAGLGQSGMARRPAEIRPQPFTVEGIDVAHLSYTWSYNGLSLPDDQEWRSALIDPERIVADAEVARIRGAEIVIVSLHWGAEKSHRPTTYQRDIAEQITSSGLIDLVVGHHAHVLQPIEEVNGTWVLYGLGNILSNLPTSDAWPAASQDAAVVTVAMTIDDDGDVRVDRPEVHPTWVDKDAGWVVRLVADELAGDDLSAGQRGRLERSLDRTERVLGDFVAPRASSAGGPDPALDSA